MKQKKYIQTIIIGGGISGLSCARRLHSAGEPFLIITKDLGGRMKASESFIANYGAAYITKDYLHVLPFVKKGERMRLRDFNFYTGKQFSNLFTFQNAKYYLKMLKLVYFAWRIRNHLLKYRKQAAHKSMREYFEENPFLLKYWLMPAKNFVRNHGLKDISHYIVDPVTSATTFVGSDKVNTVYYLSMLFPIFLKSWIVDFSETIDKLTKGYKGKIKQGEVTRVKKRKDGKYDVRTSIGHFLATNVVFAAPQKHLQKVYNLPKMNIQQDSYVFHLQGARKKKFAGKKAIIFQDQYYDIHMMWRQRDDTDIIYTQHGKPDFDRYYEKYDLIKKVHWQPAMVIPTCCIIDQVIDDNLYLASDFNVSGLEDSYLSGLYAANQIIKNNTKAKRPRSTQEANTALCNHSKFSIHKKVKDPVCEMKVHPRKTFMISHNGKDYFFCGKTCKSKFENDLP